MTRRPVLRLFAAAAVAAAAAASVPSSAPASESRRVEERHGGKRTDPREGGRAIVREITKPQPAVPDPVVSPEVCEALANELGAIRAPEATFDDRAAAAERILGIGPEAWPALRSLVGRLEGEPARWIALILGQAADGASLPGLARKFESKDPALRAAVAQAIADIRDPQALPILQRALLDPDRDVRRVAARSLSSFEPADVGPLFHSLVSALFDQDDEVRKLARAAFEALPRLEGEEGAADVVPWLIERLLAAPAEAVDDGAEFAAAIAHDGVRDSLLCAVADAARPERAGAVRALAAFGGEVVSRALEARLGDHDDRVCAAAAAALENRGDANSVRPLIGALATSRGASRDRIVSALRKLTGIALGTEAEPWQRWWIDRASEN